MMRAALLALFALTLMISPASARPARAPIRPFPTSVFAGPPITPNGLLIHDGERLRTLELDEFAPLRLRLSIPF